METKNLKEERIKKFGSILSLLMAVLSPIVIITGIADLTFDFGMSDIIYYTTGLLMVVVTLYLILLCLYPEFFINLKSDEPVDKRPLIMYQLQIVWNREFHFVNFGDLSESLERTIEVGDSLLDSGDGARVKKFRVVNELGEVVHPKPPQVEEWKNPSYRFEYICDFCDKKEIGKPVSWLKNPSLTTDVDTRKCALKPDGWDFYTLFIPPRRWRTLYSCGCEKFNRG